MLKIKAFLLSVYYGLIGCTDNATNMATSTNNESGEGVFGSADLGQKGWVGKIYRLPKGTSKLPDFDKLKPIGSLVTQQLNIPPRSFSAGFPDVPDLVEWFGLEFKATLIIPEDGCECEFTLNSDDGSQLFINDKLVIDNDGSHDPKKKTGKKKLKKGTHSITVNYFQGPRDQIALQLFIKMKHNSPEKVLPGSMIDRPEVD